MQRSIGVWILTIGVWLAAGVAAQAAPACNPAKFRTVLDVGHSPEVGGAISARGVTEFDFNLWLGRRIEREMLARGFPETTLLVTRGNARDSLFARVRSANKARADLFISIHHDSVPEWFIETWEYLGAEGRFSDRFNGHSIFVSARHPRYTKSLAFARTLGLTLKEQGLVYTPHYTEAIMGKRRRALVDKEAGVYRFDRLAVLRGTKMPAVLFEAGSIINRAEELALQSPERQAAIADAGIGERVFLLGDRSDVPELLPAFSIFAMSSVSEGYSIALLEACASALPIVATRIGGNAEIVSDGINGLVVPPSDPGALAGALLQLLGDPGLAEQMGRAGRDWLLENATFDVMASRYLDLYASGTG